MSFPQLDGVEFRKKHGEWRSEGGREVPVAGAPIMGVRLSRPPLTFPVFDDGVSSLETTAGRAWLGEVAAEKRRGGNKAAPKRTPEATGRFH